jgi:hypothetical protein
MAGVGARRVEVLSGIPGRTRYQVARVKGRSRLARELEQDVARLPGVERAQVNPLPPRRTSTPSSTRWATRAPGWPWWGTAYRLGLQ